MMMKDAPITNSVGILRKAKDGLTIGENDISRFSQLLLDRCGLYFPKNRHSELVNGIRHALAASTCTDLEEFYQVLQNQTDNSVEMDLLVNAVTVSETHFLRDTAQFDALYTQVLPKIIERKQSLRTLRIWSAGCASGEEPYSIAILLREMIPDVDNWAITIIGTDINTASLDRAHHARYGSWAFREERAKQLRGKYFRQDGNYYELAPEVRQMVLFHKLNLVEPCYPSYETNTMSMDLIFCRNVTIYFSEAVTRWVVDRFYDALIDGGWLVVGHSEPSIEIYRRFRVRNFPDTILYQRIPDTSTLRLPLPARAIPAPTPIPPPPAATPVPTPVQARSSMLKALDPGMFLPPVQEVSKAPDPMENAREFLEYGRSEDALNLLQNLLKTRPRDAEVCSLMGQAHANLGNWQEAEFICCKAIEFDKLYLEAYYTLSLVLQHESKLDQAIDVMKKVVYIDRKNILGHYGLATLYRDSGLTSHAQKSLDNALRLLQNLPADVIVPGSKGITVGRLSEAITRQQQAWTIS